MKVSFYTLGCKLNYSETSQLQDQFQQKGHEIVRFGERTDIVIVNTCTVTENADTECRKIIRRALKTSPDAFIGITGCYAQLQPEEIASIEGVDAVFGTAEKLKIHSLITDFTKTDTPRIYVDELLEPSFDYAQSADTDNRTRAFLKLQDGCNYSCSFCTIPKARGASRSMPFADILNRITSLEQQGFYEIILSGINLGDYKDSEGKKFKDILTLISSLDIPVRFRIGSIEPNLVDNDILSIIAHSTNIVPHIHIPLQSGSSEILRKMRRRYTPHQYQDLVYSIREHLPQACIGADVIVGFPGETDAHFEETCTFIQDLPFSYLHVFTYSERELTPAAAYDQKVPMNIRKLRNHRLRNLSSLKKKEFYQSQIGMHKIVIPESYDHSNGMWIGWTENYVRTQFHAAPSIVQSPISVRLDSYDDNLEIVHASALHSLIEHPHKQFIPLLIQ